MEPFVRFESVLAVLPQENIDTDQIIPARFLTTTERAGIGRGCFADWRFDAEGNEISPERELRLDMATGERLPDATDG